MLIFLSDPSVGVALGGLSTDEPSISPPFRARSSPSSSLEASLLDGGGGRDGLGLAAGGGGLAGERAPSRTEVGAGGRQGEAALGGGGLDGEGSVGVGVVHLSSSLPVGVGVCEPPADDGGGGRGGCGDDLPHPCSLPLSVSVSVPDCVSCDPSFLVFLPCLCPESADTVKVGAENTSSS
jgi:hypothetical protein